TPPPSSTSGTTARTSTPKSSPKTAPSSPKPAAPNPPGPTSEFRGHSPIHDCYRPAQHGIHHPRREPAGVRVLLRHVVAAQQHWPTLQRCFGAVAELRPRPRDGDTPPLEH